MKNYDNKLMKVLIEDLKFFNSNINKIDESVFENNSVKFILQLMKEYKQKYGGAATYEILETMVYDNLPKKEEIDEDGNKVEKLSPLYQQTIDQLKNIIDARVDDSEMLFIKDQFKKRMIDGITKKTLPDIQRGNFDNLRNAIKKIDELNNSSTEYEMKRIWELDEDIEREVIPTGLKMIDENGGVARGEIGVLLAPTGVGKSVFLTFLANNFMNNDLKVLHIVFEGSINDYLKMHKVKLGSPPNSVLEARKSSHNLWVVKMKSGQTTINDIENFMKNNDFQPDVICLDYLDLIAPTQNKKEIWQSEINTLNQLEEFCWKHNVVVWTAVQTNRSGLNNEMPNLSQMGGSVSKAQKASMVLGLSRTNQNKEDNTADVSIVKNRHGNTADSINNLWNPKEMKIEINETTTITL